MMQGFMSRIYKKFKLITQPHLRLYEGFGNSTHCTVFGHTLLLSPHRREVYGQGIFHNSFSLIKMFMVNPLPQAHVQLTWQGQIYNTISEKDGFFTFDLKNNKNTIPGRYDITVQLLAQKEDAVMATATGNIIIPKQNQFTFISDIDDTFLISHSSTLLKRLRVLLTKNAHSRRPFDGVVAHYRALQLAQTTEANPNPFFYVSSSEWNLYQFITDFIYKNGLPDGVCLLNQMKTFSGLLKTGKNNHNTKFARIVRVLEAYPTQRFILLGDDSQKDPYIYASIAGNFKNLIYCVYIRCVAINKRNRVQKELEKIEAHNIPVCYFKHSSEAMAHSKKIGLIN